MQGALIGPFRLLHRHPNRTCGERELILIPFWDLCAFIDRYLLLTYAFLVKTYSCTVSYRIFSVCIWHTTTVSLLLGTSQAYRLFLLCKWSFENFFPSPTWQPSLGNLFERLNRSNGPGSGGAKLPQCTWEQLPYASSVCFKGKENKQTSCLEYPDWNISADQVFPSAGSRINRTAAVTMLQPC